MKIMHLIPAAPRIRISIAALTDQRTVVGRVAERVLSGIAFLVGIAKDLTRHDFHAACAITAPSDAANAPIVVVDRRDRTGHMRSVVGVGVVDLPLIHLPVRIRPVEIRRVVDEVVSVLVAFRRVGIDPDIGLQIGVRILDGLVDHRHDNVAAALIFLPRVEQVDVGARLE